MQWFHIPMIRNQLGRQPIEKLRMCRSSPVQTEVLGTCDERLAEVAAPQMIHRHTRRSRIGGVGNPLRECRATACARFRVLNAEGREGVRDCLRRLSRSGQLCFRICDFIIGGIGYRVIFDPGELDFSFGYCDLLLGAAGLECELFSSIGVLAQMHRHRSGHTTFYGLVTHPRKFDLGFR